MAGRRPCALTLEAFIRARQVIIIGMTGPVRHVTTTCRTACRSLAFRSGRRTRSGVIVIILTVMGRVISGRQGLSTNGSHCFGQFLRINRRLPQ